jgi:hypothetical protein
MVDFNKIREFCSKFRIVLGTVVVLLGFYFVGEDETYNIWFMLGILPLIAGITKFCPLCIITKKCDIPQEA